MKNKPNEKIPVEVHIAGEEQDGEKKKDESKSERELALAEAQEEFGEFFSGLEKTINAYFGTPDMTFSVRPEGWYIDLEDIRVNADPTFLVISYLPSSCPQALIYPLNHK